MNTAEKFLTFENKGFGRTEAAAITPTLDGYEALALAGIDWTVCTTHLDDVYGASTIPCPRNAADTVISTRSDTGAIVGVNGKQHKPIQNTVLAVFANTLRKVRPDATISAGGSKNGGSTTFLVVSLPDGLNLGDGDTVYRQFLIYTSHNGGKVIVLPVQFRPNCLNQWSGLLKSSGARLVSVAHTASADTMILQATRTLEAAATQFDQWDLALRTLMNTPARIGDHVDAIAGEKPDDDGRSLTEWENRRDRVYAEWSADWNVGLAGTALGIVMAAQGADEHRGRCGKGKRDEQRVGRLITGSYPMATRALRSLATV